VVTRAKFVLPLTLLISLSAFAAESGRPIPRIERVGNQYRLLVDGQPFLMLGGQAHNSSANRAEDLQPFWKSVVGIHGNTAEVPLYWELIEPEAGKFDFHLIDEIVAGARRNGFRLVFLWFATWKNGNMDYTPEWLRVTALRTGTSSAPAAKRCGLSRPCAQRLATGTLRLSAR